MVLEMQFNIFSSFIIWFIHSKYPPEFTLSIKIISYIANITYSVFLNYFRPFALKELLQTKLEQNDLRSH